MIARIRAHFAHLLSWLNWIGAVALAYALANPGAAGELIALLPASVKPYAPILAILWFALVQFAKAQTIAKAKQ